MKKRSQYDIEFFRRSVLMAEQIVHADKIFQDYAGAPFEIGDRMAKIDFLLQHMIRDQPTRLILKLMRSYLLQQKKAFFAGVLANQITMLAFLKGGKLAQIDAILNPQPRSETP